VFITNKLEGAQSKFPKTSTDMRPAVEQIQWFEAENMLSSAKNDY
jgi:hypothetical protein